MDIILRQTQLYNFLNYCENSDLEKVVLDCGAGGDLPPLALFDEYGYKTFGVEIDKERLNEAKEYSDEKDLQLNIIRGDMRSLAFDDEGFSFVYSYNSIFHMNKKDIEKSIEEIKRVLLPEGLIYVNFLSTDDFLYGKGEKVGGGEFSQKESTGKVIHSFHTDSEADRYFDGMDILIKQKRNIERKVEGEKIKQSYLDYIARKL